MGMAAQPFARWIGLSSATTCVGGNRVPAEINQHLHALFGHTRIVVSENQPRGLVSLA